VTGSHRALLVLAISGALGFRVGIVGYPTWQICLETAQVVAGLVKYPADNPFYIYHTKLWSILIQGCALLLKAGMSEITLSLLISGLVGMISFQALAMVVYALGGDAFVAVGSAFVIFISGVTNHGVVYPVFLLGTHHTYGAIGLSAFVLVLALIAAGCRRTGAFLLGVAPALHPSLGIWIGAVVMVALLWDRELLRTELRPAVKYFAAGCAVTLVSLLAQFLFIYDVPAVDEAAAARVFSTFVSTWDAHRRVAVDVSAPGAVFNRIALAIALVWIVGFARDLPRSALFFLCAVAVSAIVSLLFVFLTRISPDRLPVTLSILMPARLFNFNIFVIAPVLLGLLAAYRTKLIAQVLTFVLLAGLLLLNGSAFWDWVGQRGWTVWSIQPDAALLLEGVGLALVCLALLDRQHVGPSFSSGATPDLKVGPTTTTRIIRFGSFAVIFVAFALTWSQRSSRAGFRDRTNDRFYQTVAADRRGLTVTAGSFQLVQLYTRRPVLIDSGALDTMVYARESGPAMERVLNDVYGIDFFNPPPGVRSSSMVPHEINKAVWAAYSEQRWRELRRTYNVSQVLTRSDYELNLPIAAETEGLRLYRIPD
jgi:hypothetical protein